MKNKYVTEGGTTSVFITRKDGSEFCCYVDSEDIGKISAFSWYVSKCSRTGYLRACSTSGSTAKDRKHTKMHRLIMDAPANIVVDHINHNALDNRKSNLRLATQPENLQNRAGATCNNVSGHRGVTWDTIELKWRVRVVIDGVTKHLGRFTDLLKAAAVASAYRQENMPFSLEYLRVS